MLAHERQTSPSDTNVVDVAIRPSIWRAAPTQDRQSTQSGASQLRGLDWFAPLLLILCDVVSWVLLYGITGYIRRDAFFTTPFEFMLVDCLVLAVIVQAIYIIGGYDRNTETRSLTYTTEHILAMIGAAIVSSFIIYSAATFDQGMRPSRGVLFLSFVTFTPFSMFYRRIVHARMATRTAQRAFLVIGSGELARSFYQAYRTSPNRQRLEFIGTDPASVGKHIAGAGSPIIESGIEERLAQIDRRYSGVILASAPSELGPTMLDRLVRTQFQRTRVYTLESFYETHWRHVPLHTIDPFWPLQMGFQLARISPYHYLKRLFDIAVSTLLLLVLSPLVIALMCLVWLTSGRPALFRQTRVGREGNSFIAYKLRTMKMRFDEDEDIYTREDDPRVTPLGHWLRKLRFDELPQLWNVLRGDMSLIGPRAEWTKCAERYENKIPFYHFRHLVKPGITGWAQVNYPYGESDEDAIEKLKYDLYYIRRYSLKLDAMIFLKTIHTVLFGKGR